jgi:hypothetical protein
MALTLLSPDLDGAAIPVYRRVIMTGILLSGSYRAPLP